MFFCEHQSRSLGRQRYLLIIFGSAGHNKHYFEAIACENSRVKKKGVWVRTPREDLMRRKGPQRAHVLAVKANQCYLQAKLTTEDSAIALLLLHPFGKWG